MKLLLIAFAVIAVVAADVSHLSNEYLPPVREAAPVAAPTNEYLPPVQEAPVRVAPAPAPVQVQVAAPAPAPAPVQYAAPVQVAAPAPVEAAPAHVLADDGYRYKTHRRVVYRRHRRDVSHLPSNEYLPPVQQSAPVAAPTNEYLPPVQEAPVRVAPAPVQVQVAAPAPAPVQYTAPAPAPVQVQVSAPAPVEAAPAHVLADDGYRYKTHRRVVYRRHRRDVSHLPSNEYLPPVQQSAPVAAPTNEYLPPVQEAPVRVAPAPVQVQVAAPAPAPVQYSAPAPAPVQVQVSAPAPVEAAPAHVLADDGYRYKTHRRVVYRRHRRDVSHLPSNEYLPPVQESAPVQVAATEYHYEPVQVAAPAPVQVAAPAPVQVAAPAPAPVRYEAPQVQYVAPAPAPVEVEAAPAHELANDGYRYKTHRRVVYRRHRRDVSHLPSNEYLPPVQEAPAVQYVSNDIQESAPVAYEPAPAPVQYSAPVQVAAPAPVEVAPAHELADDGYRYKTHRRVVYRRHRRDVSHLPSNEYLPPVQESAPVQAVAVQQSAPVQYTAVQESAPVQYAAVQESAPVEAAPAHVLADDGYRYKTHRRVVYRRH
ncbi:skin secretory protein xP2 [Teleopsis dalmanni]|uniref:skin secretory protein xP2 n=1 Tax=Teleopsis dalmanni TaxID=139649 RepID=UPI0018CF384A|nr:skin secretory protein xP2 [Teleopsis dalmanni]